MGRCGGSFCVPDRLANPTARPSRKQNTACRNLASHALGCGGGAGQQQHARHRPVQPVHGVGRARGRGAGRCRGRAGPRFQNAAHRRLSVPPRRVPGEPRRLAHGKQVTTLPQDLG